MNKNQNDINATLKEVMNFEEDQLLERQEENDPVDQEVKEHIEIMDQIIAASCGRDENGASKAAVTVSIDEWHFLKKIARTVLSYSSYKPTISFQKHYEFIQIDLSFASKVDNDMKVIWNHTEKFGNMIDAVTGETDIIPFYSLTIVPVEYQGRYYITATNPVFWCLQPGKPGADSNVLRLLFRAENIGFYETDEIDEYEIEANVQRSLMERERVSEAYERAEEDATSFAEERNRKIEEMRRNN